MRRPKKNQDYIPVLKARTLQFMGEGRISLKKSESRDGAGLRRQLAPPGWVEGENFGGGVDGAIPGPGRNVYRSHEKLRRCRGKAF